MIELVLAFVFIVLIVVGMSVGAIFANKPIKGSCGGIAALGMDTSCDICGGDTSKCEEEQSAGGASAIAYDATDKR
ncbi:MAG TPA: ApbE family protein [Porticoccaceae bacterium]|nr:ApbE family protein [Porticoccaceae bacterium]